MGEGAAGRGQGWLEPRVEVARGRVAQQEDAGEGGEKSDDGEEGGASVAGSHVVGAAGLPAEDGAEQGAEGQQHARGFEPEVDDVVGEHGDHAGHQRGFDPIPARLLPEPARDPEP